MTSQLVPRSESLVTKATRKKNPLQVVRFNVVSDVHCLTFLSTQLASVSSSLVFHFSKCDYLAAFLHHRFHLFIKLLQVSRGEIRNCQPPFIAPVCSWRLIFAFICIQVWQTITLIKRAFLVWNKCIFHWRYRAAIQCDFAQCRTSFDSEKADSRILTYSQT